MASINGGTVTTVTSPTPSSTSASSALSANVTNFESFHQVITHCNPKSTFENGLSVNHNPMHQTGSESGLSNPSIQSSIIQRCILLFTLNYGLNAKNDIFMVVFMTPKRSVASCSQQHFSPTITITKNRHYHDPLYYLQ